MTYIEVLPFELQHIITYCLDYRQCLCLSDFFDFISTWYSYHLYNIIPILDKMELSYTVYYTEPTPYSHKVNIVFYRRQHITKREMLDKLKMFSNDYIASLNFSDNPALTDEMTSIARRSIPREINKILYKHGYSEYLKCEIVIASE